MSCTQGIVEKSDLGKLGILKNKSSLGWSGFGSITQKEQRKNTERTPKHSTDSTL
jgi:hypothetical protein